MWSHSYLKYLKTPFCSSFAAVHGPPTASNLLVTWRRRHGDAKITRQSVRSRDWGLKTSWMGRGEVQSCCHASLPPWSLCRQHLPGRTWESERNERREEMLGCFQIVSFLPRQSWKQPLLPPPHTPPPPSSDSTSHCKRSIFLFVCLSSGGFNGCLRRFLTEAEVLNLWIRHQLKVAHFQLFYFPSAPPSERQWTVGEANWEGRADQGCLFICLYTLLEL